MSSEGDLFGSGTVGTAAAAATDEALASRPLADRLRPQALNDYVGQQHLLGPDQPLGEVLRQGRLHSMIFWGPPGTGKTTLARLLSSQVASQWISLSAVLSGVKDIREAVQMAEHNRQRNLPTVLFVDEVHRFNKAQQDAFLPHVEGGTITFIGATTENPSFTVNSALLSRARVYVLRHLENADLLQVIRRGCSELNKQITDSAANLLADLADGDARRCLNVLEIAAQLAPDIIDEASMKSAGGERLRRFDKGGDVFYDQISALHKSVRGSAPDAALYWFCRMLDGGADPLYVGRRMLRIASEDVGNADPRALELTSAALSTYERLGSPEGELALAQAVLYLASVPKSDAAYQAFKAATALVKETNSYPVPDHLRNAPTTLMKDLGFGREYRHAHNERIGDEAYAAGENYFPTQMQPQTLYAPTTSGLEAKISNRLQRLRAMDTQAASAKAERSDQDD